MAPILPSARLIREGQSMLRSFTPAFMLALACVLPLHEAAAQDPIAGGILGGVAGGLLGGAIGGRRGAGGRADTGRAPGGARPPPGPAPPPTPSLGKKSRPSPPPPRGRGGHPPGDC